MLHFQLMFSTQINELSWDCGCNNDDLYTERVTISIRNDLFLKNFKLLRNHARTKQECKARLQNRKD